MSSPSNFKIKIKNSNKPYSSVLMLCIYIQEKANVIEQQQNSLPREFCVWHHLKSQRMNLYSAFIETCFISLTYLTAATLHIPKPFIPYAHSISFLWVFFRENCPYSVDSGLDIDVLHGESSMYTGELKWHFGMRGQFKMAKIWMCVIFGLNK